MRKQLLGLAILACIALPSAAQAVTFDWSYTGTGVSGSGTFDATPIGVGSLYAIDAITGTANGQTITGFAGYAQPDQSLYFPITPSLDHFGVSFTVTGGAAYNIYSWTSAGAGVTGYDCGATGYCMIGPGQNNTDGLGDPSNGIPQDTTVPVDFTLTVPSATPLPAALPLFLTAVSALGLVMWRRNKNA